MATYRVTFEIDAVDKDDALHWANWLASYETVMRRVDIVSVVRHVHISDDDQDIPVEQESLWEK